jgi:UDP-N-acetylmuramoyl-tripeptide--D-alanyl-D-alanine ligase
MSTADEIVFINPPYRPYAPALAAAAGLEAIRRGLESIQPVPGRLCLRRGLEGSTVVDDTYNANPASLRAALDVVAAMPGEAWLVLGDMGELGPDAKALHAQMGEAARRRGIRRLFALGELSAAAAEAFGAGGRVFDDGPALVAAVRESLRAGVNVLVKGSRAMHMERVAAELVQAPEPLAGPPAAEGH